MKSSSIFFLLFTAITSNNIDAQSSETKWVDLVDHSHDPEYKAFQGTLIPSQTIAHSSNVYLRGGSRHEIYEKLQSTLDSTATVSVSNFEANPFELSPPKIIPLPSQPGYETQATSFADSLQYEKSDVPLPQEHGLNVMPQHLSEANYQRSVPSENNIIELSTEGAIADTVNAIVSPEVAAVIGKTLVEKERLVQHLDSKLQEAGEIRDYDTAARLHAELKEAKEHVSQLQTDLFAAAAATAVIPNQVAVESSESLSTDSASLPFATAVANPTAADGVAATDVSQSNGVDQNLDILDSQLVGDAGGAATAPIEALAPPEIVPLEISSQVLQSAPVNIENVDSNSAVVANPTAADGVGDVAVDQNPPGITDSQLVGGAGGAATAPIEALAPPEIVPLEISSQVVESPPNSAVVANPTAADGVGDVAVDQNPPGITDSQLVGGAGGAAGAPIEALAPPEIVPLEISPQVLQAPPVSQVEVAVPATAGLFPVEAAAPILQESALAASAVVSVASSLSEASIPTNSVISYIAESKAACKAKLEAKKLDLSGGLTAAKKIIDHFLAEAKFSGIKELTIQFLANKVADANEAYRPETIDSQGCRVSDVKLDPHQTHPTELLKAGPDGKTLYRISASLPLGTLATTGCNSLKCVTLGEYCDITTQEALVAHTSSSLQLESAELSLLASQSSASLQRRLVLQQLFPADDVAAAGQLGAKSDGGLIFLAWEYLRSGYSVEVNKNYNALDFNLWKPHASISVEGESSNELDFLTGHMPCTW